jgi:DNA-directed RNA polymerase subunit RPC12/RpoP
MADSRRDQLDRPQQQLYCRTCKEEFAAYKSDLTAGCPRCGRVVRMPLHRHILRLVAVAILGAIAIAIILAYVRHV